MAASALQARRHHQRRIAALLDDLEQRRHRLAILRARGAQPAGLRDLKAELQMVRDELAAAVDGGPRADGARAAAGASEYSARAADHACDAGVARPRPARSLGTTRARLPGGRKVTSPRTPGHQCGAGALDQ